MDSKDPDIHVLDGWMPATKVYLHASSTQTECNYRYDWLKNSNKHKNHIPKHGEPQRYTHIAGNAEEEDRGSVSQSSLHLIMHVVIESNHSLVLSASALRWAVSRVSLLLFNPLSTLHLLVFFGSHISLSLSLPLHPTNLFYLSDVQQGWLQKYIVLSRVPDQNLTYFDLCLLIPSGTKGRNSNPPANSILAGPP